MFGEPVAHITKGGVEHPLREHLLRTADLAGEFAAAFGFREWGRLAGLWHDLGKYSKAFQDKLQGAAGDEAHLESGSARVDHSTAGALWAVERFGVRGRLLSYLVAGHHAGLPDWEADSTGRAALSQRLMERKLLAKVLDNGAPAEILEQQFPSEKPAGRDPAFWIRMLFSCVVDADFLDTEGFFDSTKSGQRGGYPDLSELLPPFTEYMNGKQEAARHSPVNRVRAAILARCIEKAKELPGVFSLTVPTGGGKTLSSMAFALHHAAIHGHRRVIYVIPYTSIIEQTASQFREVFDDGVVEHHSNVSSDDPERETPRSRLACENWDAPIVVTTSVQFFESLFASRTGRCRKLHNIAGSVVVLDEVQLLPPEFLTPILGSLEELRKNYAVTVLLCTATQPAFDPYESDGFRFEGLPGRREIVEDPPALFASLKRVEVRAPKKLSEPTTWDDLAQELAAQPSVLCVVNRRDDCRQLWSLMPAGTFHLSALMCGAHRSTKISEIKARLHAGLGIRVISTQLVEAGVDLDFPVVYRAMAGLDSVAQAAGRCNREGLIDRGTLKVFMPPSRPPAGVLRQAAEIGARLLEVEGLDPLAPESFTSFFRELYWVQGTDRLDARNIVGDLRAGDQLRFSFRSAAAKFKMIDDVLQAPVLVIYGEEGAKLVDQVTRFGPERWLLRKLQRYVVNLPTYLHDKLRREGLIREVHPGIFVQGYPALYDDEVGFCPDGSAIYQPDELIV